MSKIQSIERAFAVLDIVGGLSEPASVTTIAKQVDLPRTTVTRLLATLQSVGAVKRATAKDYYQIGPRILNLTAQLTYTQQLVNTARPYLEKLAQTTGETVYLGVPEHYHVHYVDQINSRYRIQLRDWTGSLFPMHTAAAGLLFLADLPLPELDDYLSRPLERYTEKTVDDPATIRENLVNIRRQGHAWSQGQMEPGLIGVAAPIQNKQKQSIAAISVGGPVFRFPPQGQKEATINLVINTAAEIAARL